jgi:predicted transcriptional regulator
MYTFPPLKDSDDINEVYRLFGIAAHHCSNIEKRILMFLFEPMSFKEKKLTEEKIDEVAEKLYSMTLGQLLHKIKQNYNLDKDQEEYWRGILEKRNHLMHHFYASYGTKMHLSSTLIQMQKELKNTIYELQEASLWLDKQVMQYLDRRGLLDLARKTLHNILGSNKPPEETR